MRRMLATADNLYICMHILIITCSVYISTRLRSSLICRSRNTPASRIAAPSYFMRGANALFMECAKNLKSRQHALTSRPQIHYCRKKANGTISHKCVRRPPRRSLCIWLHATAINPRGEPCKAPSPCTYT